MNKLNFTAFATLCLGVTVFATGVTFIHKLNIKKPADLREYFSYSIDRIPLISTHRGGGYDAGFPEENIVTFENTLKNTPTTLEIDPRYTKDSIVILEHDPTLDRATTGKGKVSDYTWDELKKLNLKDKAGNITPYHINTLDEVLDWVKGKTVVLMDKKDVPWNVLEKKIRDHKAEANAMVLVHDIEDAQHYYNANKNIMLEVEVFDKARVLELDKSGVPWKNILAYVGFSKPDNKELFDMIHQRGAMCLFKAGRIADKEFVKGKTDVYDILVQNGIDVVEPNLPKEAYHSISKFALKNSSKSKFFREAEIKN